MTTKQFTIVLLSTAALLIAAGLIALYNPELISNIQRKAFIARKIREINAMAPLTADKMIAAKKSCEDSKFTIRWFTNDAGQFVDFQCAPEGKEKK
jgi:hypothetical protein